MTMTTNTFDTPTSGEPVADRPTVAPAVDIFENDHELLLVADMPGVPADGIHIDYDRDRLTIHGRRRASMPEGATGLYGVSPDYDYRRVFTVPDTIDAEGISASLDGGVLTLTLPRHERAKPRRIAIKSRS